MPLLMLFRTQNSDPACQCIFPSSQTELETIHKQNHLQLHAAPVEACVLTFPEQLVFEEGYAARSFFDAGMLFADVVPTPEERILLQ